MPRIGVDELNPSKYFFMVSPDKHKSYNILKRRGKLTLFNYQFTEESFRLLCRKTYQGKNFMNHSDVTTSTAVTEVAIQNI